MVVDGVIHAIKDEQFFTVGFEEILVANTFFDLLGSRGKDMFSLG